MPAFTPPRKPKATLPASEPRALTPVPSVASISGQFGSLGLADNRFRRIGSYDNPAVCRVTGYSGTYINGYSIFYQDKMFSGKKNYNGYLFMKKCDPRDLPKNMAEMATYECKCMLQLDSLAH